MLVGLYVLALALRLVYLVEIQDLPTFDTSLLDEQYHLQLARQILSGSLPAEPYFRAPLYPYFLAGIVAVTGDEVWWPRVLQIVVGAFLPVLLAYLGRKLFDWRIGIAAGVVAAMYPSFLFYEGSLLIESIMPVAIILLLVQLQRCREVGSFASFLIGGILLGVNCLLRPNMLLFVPALLLWCWLVFNPTLGFAKALKRYLVLVFGCAITIAPVTLRNYVVSGDPVLIAWQGGINFYIGNNHNSNGWSAGVREFGSSWESLYSSPVALAEKALGGAVAEIRCI
ncbi:MAG: glycosyltransferase family 39 protein [Candidatus Zixiibacteriota bacterium]